MSIKNEQNAMTCKLCDYKTSSKYNMMRHLSSDKHDTTAKTSNKYMCAICDYNASSKYNLSRHYSTDKHNIQRVVSGKEQDDKHQEFVYKNTNMMKIPSHKKEQQNEQNSLKKEQNEEQNEQPNIYICECGKKYPYRSSLFNHKKKCFFVIKLNNVDSNPTISDDNSIYKSLLMEVMNQNKEFKNMILEQNKEFKNMILEQNKELIPKINNNAINFNNSNNKFNINVFLNEQCKNAMSMSDFVKNMEISVPDLLNTKDKGLAEGISNLIVSNLNKIPLILRPLWCSDKKRKRLFIKEDIWVEDIGNNKTKAAIKNVAHLQSKNINAYTKLKPNWLENDNDKDTYIGIVNAATQTIDDKTDKIIDKIINTIHYDKDIQLLM
jgi:hypothetical protein